MKSSYNAGLQSLALALIFMPEPFTTPIGVGLLVYARMAQRQTSTTPRRRPDTFEDRYNVRLNMLRGTTITYELFPKQRGQMPKSYPKIAVVRDNRQVMKALRQKTLQQSRSYVVSSSRHEPAGLMRGPKLKDRAALATDWRAPTK